MRIVIDKGVIENNNLTPAEALYLLFLNQLDVNNTEDKVLESLAGKGFINISGKKFLTIGGANALSKLVLETQALDTKDISDDNLLDIVIAMQKVYPAGMKPENTPYGPRPSNTAWRGNKRDLVERLRKFFARYGNNYTKEQLVEATKKYVNSFGEDTRYMRVLPYFIMKSERKMHADGITSIEEVSNLANILESEDDYVKSKSDGWLEETL